MIRGVSIRARILVAMFVVLLLALTSSLVILDSFYASRLDEANGTAITTQRRDVTALAGTAANAQVLLGAVSRSPARVSLSLADGRQLGERPPDQARAETFTVRGTGELDYATVTVWIDLAEQVTSRDALRGSLGIMVAIVLVGASIVILVVTDVALKPLNLVSQAAQRITAGERGIRLNPDKPDTELGRTMVTIDRMLDELEGAEKRAITAEQAATETAAQMQTFLSDAAHELKTPLAGIQAAAETLVQMDPEDVAGRERLEYLLAREASRGGHLVSSLLEAARVDAGPSLRLADVDLFGLALDEKSRLALTQPGLTVVVQGAPLSVRADRQAITSTLRNLVDNGARAAGPDGVLAIRVDRFGDLAQVDVANTGEPIPEADRERVFHRLVRLSSVASTTQGSGLGLPIARGYARAHGGDLRYLAGSGGVQVPGQPGFGSCFRIELPIAGPDAAAGPPPEALLQSPAGEGPRHAISPAGPASGPVDLIGATASGGWNEPDDQARALLA